MTTLPFRADQVGSLLRPTEILEAHGKFLRGQMTAETLREIEDRHIKTAIRLQEDAGFGAVTDGEFRRTAFHFDFLDQLDGVTAKLPVMADPGAGADKPRTPPTLAITGKVRHVRPIEVDAFKFVKANTKRVAKQAIPSPTMLLRGGRAAASREAYPDLAELDADIATAFQAEIAALHAAGCNYLQLDDTNLAYLCDPKVRENLVAQGEDPIAVMRRYAAVINNSIAKRPAGMTICIHLCRGNMQSAWAASGGYEPIAEVMLGSVNVDGFFLEFDTERAGGFEPLRFLPKNKRVVLGLISSKVARLETREEVKRRIDDATKFAALDQYCLSPQCGFASGYNFRAMSEDEQKRKLELVVSLATEVWGTAQ